MKIAIHPMRFDWQGGDRAIAPTLNAALERLEDAGVHSIWPMDHFFQIGVAGPVEDPMLEGWATIAWAAARTRRLELGTLVTGVHYRHPGLLAKFATTVDVLSAGRVWIGIGAGWNEEESRGLGVPFPPVSERFERLEESLQILNRMFDRDETPYVGRHYQLERPLNSPAPLRRPPILLGGGGERRTLRMVAQYADACNVFEWEAERKLEVLRQRCEEVGRPYDDLVRTTSGLIGDDRDADRLVARCERLADLGVDMAFFDLPNADDPTTYDLIAEVCSRVEPLGRPTPELLRGEPVATTPAP